MSPMSTAVVTTDYRLVQSLLDRYQKITFENLPDVLIECMKFVSDSRELSGPEKKRVVIATVVDLVDASDLAGSLEPVVLHMLPHMIDKLIAVEKKQISINPSVYKGLTACCFPKKK